MHNYKFSRGLNAVSSTCFDFFQTMLYLNKLTTLDVVMSSFKVKSKKFTEVLKKFPVNLRLL